MSDWKESARKRKDFRQGGGPEPTGKGNRSRKSKKRLILVQEKYVGPPRKRFWGFLDDKDWSGWNNHYSLKNALESFISSRYETNWYKPGAYEFRIINKKTKEVLIENEALIRMKKGVKNGVWTITEYLRDEHLKDK